MRTEPSPSYQEEAGERERERGREGERGRGGGREGEGERERERERGRGREGEGERERGREGEGEGERGWLIYMYTVHGIHVHSTLAYMSVEGTPDKQYTHVHIYCTWNDNMWGQTSQTAAVSLLLALISREYA